MDQCRNPLFIGSSFRTKAGRHRVHRPAGAVVIPFSSGQVFGLSNGTSRFDTDVGRNPLFIGSSFRTESGASCGTVMSASASRNPLFIGSSFRTCESRTRRSAEKPCSRNPLFIGSSFRTRLDLALFVDGKSVVIPFSSGQVFGLIAALAPQRTQACRNPLFIGSSFRTGDASQERFRQPSPGVVIPFSSGQVFGQFSGG